MNRLIRGAAGAALAITLTAGAVNAQTALTVGTGAGLSIPVGDLADVTGLGWNAQANIGLNNPMWPVALRFDVMYHSLPGEEISDALDIEGPDLTVLAGIANAELYVARAANGGGFFIVGGAGIYNFDAEDVGDIESESSTDFGILGGAGYKLAMTNLLLSIEGKFHHVFADENAQFIPVNIAVEIPLGGR
jgi:hypothetical protein